MTMALGRYFVTGTGTQTRWVNPWAGFVLVAVGLLLTLTASARAQEIVAFGGAAPSVVQAKVTWSDDKAHAGDQRALAIELEIREKYHINPNQAQIDPNFDYLIPLTVKVSSDSPALTIGSTQFPKAHLVTVRYTGQPTQLLSYDGKVVLYVPVLVKDSAPAGSIPVTVQVNYQACDEQTCLAPGRATLETALEIVEPAQTIAMSNANAELFRAFDNSVYAALARGEIAGDPELRKNKSDDRVKLDFFGRSIELDASTGLGLALVLLTALIAGVLLNVTPCVLPVIPIKVMSLHHQSGAGGRAKVWKLGAFFTLGIVASFVLLGALVAGFVGGLEKLEWGQIFSYPSVSITLGLIIIAMALGMFELYEIRLPNSVYMLNPSHDTVAGNFMMGVLTAVLSTPCTGPMLGGAIAWAAKQPWWLSLGTFSVMGLGMALPYALLMANPKWVDRLPRTGPASVLVKQVMGLLLIAVAAFFLGPVIPGKGEWWVVALFISVAMLWLIVRSWQITKRIVPRIAVTIPAIALLVTSVAAANLLTQSGPIPWQAFSKQAFEKARSENRTVLLEFTADWCGNCKALELSTYRDKRLADFFRDGKAIAFQVDLTSQDNVEGWSLQRQLGGGGGIPLAAIYHGNSPEPTRVFQGLFGSDQLIETLRSHDAATAAR